MAESILITGGAGFIGANLIEYFLNTGARHLRILDNLSTGQRNYVDGIASKLTSNCKIEFYLGDVRDREQIVEALQGIDSVVHLAAQTNVVESLQEPAKTFEINALGTLNLLEACRRTGVKTVIYASSNAAVGEHDPPIDENKIAIPISPYGAAKLSGESLCLAFHHSFGVQVIILRFANVYGPYCAHKESVIAKFIRRAKENKPLIVFGDGTQTRDFIHARDVCRAISLAIKCAPNLRSTSPIFQIATGVETRIIDLVQRIQELATHGGIAGPEVVFAPARKGEIHRNYADIRKATSVLGFQAKVSLREGLKELWLWDDENRPR